jgi:hypothetical protein
VSEGKKERARIGVSIPITTSPDKAELISRIRRISPRNPNMSLPPRTPMPSSVVPAAPLAPAANTDPSVGGLLARLMAAAGVDPDNPNQLAPPPFADQLRAFYRDDPAQPWFMRGH